MAFTALTGSVLLAAAFAGSASAHVPSVSLSCDHGLTVDLTQYNSGGTNTVGVWIDGSSVAGSPFTFSSAYSHAFAVTPATQAHTAKVVVSAWDDPTGSKGWSKTFNKSIGACEQPTPVPTPVPTPIPTPIPTPVPTPIPTPVPTPVPTPTPTEIPTPTPVLEINVTAVTCDQGDAEAPQTPRIRVLGLLIGLHLFLNEDEVTLDGNGEVAVAPGLYSWSVRDGEGAELKAGELEVEACATAETPTPTVVNETPTPRITPPSTDAGMSDGSSGQNGLPVVLMAIAGIIAAAVVLTPRRQRSRR